MTAHSSSDVAASGAPARPMHARILIGLAVGAAAGVAARAWLPPGPDGAANPTVARLTYYLAEPLGQIFLRLIFMIVLPLLFCALVVGVAGSGDFRRLGRIGLLTLIFTTLLSMVSVGIGVLIAGTTRPGARLEPEQRLLLQQRYAAPAAQTLADSRQAKSLRDVLLDIIPRNPFREMVFAMDGTSQGGGILAVMCFALAVGVALLFMGQQAAPLLSVLAVVYEVCMLIVGFAMRLAPLGVAGLMFALTAALGFDILRMLVGFVLTVLAGLALHLLASYSLTLAVFARLSPLRFFRNISEALVTAFGTSSSNATLPTSLRVAQDRLKVRREVAGFVLTVGSTANQNGTALFEGVTVLFLAQVFGVPLTITQQITVAFMCILAGIGTAGVPGGSLPFVAIVLQSVGVPAEGIGIIIGVDRLLDMCRTTLNVAGDLVIAACVDRWEPRVATPVESTPQQDM